MRLGISLIFPTLNEEQRLGATLAAARAAFRDDAEYLVVDGGSTDATVQVAESSGAKVIMGARGRGAQMDHGFQAATGDICVFVHADTHLPITARASIQSALQDPAVAGGAFSLEFDENSRGLRFLQGAINLRTRAFGTATGDQVIFARTDALRAIGGVPGVPLFEDVRLCRALKRAGRFVILRERVGTSARLWRELGLARGILLHLGFRTLHALGASPALLVKYYPSPR